MLNKQLTGETKNLADRSSEGLYTKQNKGRVDTDIREALMGRQTGMQTVVSQDDPTNRNINKHLWLQTPVTHKHQELLQ
jgi:hypothetical protein